MPDFTSGTADPTITPDPGAGLWNVESWSADTVAFIALFWNTRGAANIAIGDDATHHMAHYLQNTGNNLTIDLAGMVSEVPSARQLYEREFALAKQYVSTLPAGVHPFTSARAVNGYNTKAESRNWFFAIGGYSVWSKGTARITGSPGNYSYSMDWEYKFFDRYNWDGGKSVTLFGVTITDAFMGRMHREGLAKEYNCYGSVTRQEQWGAPVVVPGAPGWGGRGR